MEHQTLGQWDNQYSNPAYYIENCLILQCTHVYFAKRVQFYGEDSSIGDKKITVEEWCLVLREVLKM